MVYSSDVYPDRSTLLKEPNEPWKVLEYNCLCSEKEDPFEVIPASEPGTVLTVVCKSQIVPNILGRP